MEHSQISLDSLETIYFITLKKPSLYFLGSDLKRVGFSVEHKFV